MLHPATADTVSGQTTDHLRQRGLGLQRMQLADGNHQIGCCQRELFAEGSGGVIQGEIRW